MTRPIVVEFNVQTQVETSREMNDNEYANHLEVRAQAEILESQEPDSVV